MSMIRIGSLNVQNSKINRNVVFSPDGKNNARKTLDHIFIPKTWIIEKIRLIKDETLNSITYNNGVYVDIKIK